MISSTEQSGCSSVVANNTTEPPAKDLLEQIWDLARKKLKTIVLAEPQDDRVLQAADKVIKEKIANIILLGEKDSILRKADELSLSLDEAKIIEPHREVELAEKFASQYYEKRKHKGISLDTARKIIKSSNLFFGAMLVANDICDGMVAGSLSPTADVIRAAIHCIGPRDEIKTVSSFFIMVTPRVEFGINGVLIFADAGFIPDPTPEQLVDIAASSAESCKSLLDAEPIIAFLSFSTYGSAKHPMVEKVQTAVRLFKEKYSGIYKADGEFQVDAAIVPEVAKRKAPTSHVAGRANILIFPDLNSGNIGYKLVERFARAKAIGPILQGLKKPVNDLSRGCKWEDIVDTVAITAIQADLCGRKGK